MLQQELNDEIGKVFGLKAGEVKLLDAKVNLGSKDLYLTLLIKADSVKAKRAKAILLKAANGACSSES